MSRGREPDARDIIGERAKNAITDAQLAGEVITLRLQPFTAFIVVGQLQLALRHPYNQTTSDPAVADMVRVTQDFVREVANSMGLDVAAAVELGFDPNKGYNDQSTSRDWPMPTDRDEGATRYWFDTEFIEDGTTIDLLSIGMVCEDGREFYAENLEVNWDNSNEWVWTNVLPHLDPRRHGRSRADIAEDLLAFVDAGAKPPEFWAYYGDYDWVALCQLYGRMVDLPKSWPMFAMDVKQLSVFMGNPELPEQTTTEHHSLADARWTRDTWLWLTTEQTAITRPSRPA